MSTRPRYDFLRYLILIMNKITLLGTGTCQIQHDRMASSVLLEIDDMRVVYDFGRGITQQILNMGLKSDDIEHIVLSHFHTDHISDIIPFLHAASWSQIDPRKRKLNIYGGLGVKVQIMRLISLFGPDELVRDERFEVVIHEIRNEEFVIGKTKFHFPVLPPANNHGLKFEFAGRTYAFTGDSHFHEQEIDFLKDVDLAVIDSGHITDDNIVELAVLSQAKTIICSHLYRDINEKTINLRAVQRGYRGELVVAQDLFTCELPGEH